jgi:hypothetical protein
MLAEKSEDWWKSPEKAIIILGPWVWKLAFGYESSYPG